MPPPPIHLSQYQTVSLDRIDIHNDNFRITTRDDIDDLLPSIRYAGLAAPPVLSGNSSGYLIISGFRRIAVCRKLGWREVLARVLVPAGDQLEYLHIAIADNALQRKLNLIETSRALYKLASLVGSSEKLAEAASISSLPSNLSVISKIKDLCQLPSAVQNCIINETISLAMANELALMDSDTAIDLCGIFSLLKLSLNKQRELISLVREIAHRQDVSIRQVLADEFLQAILNNDNLDVGHKARQIRTFLRKWRFPRITAAEEHYNFHAKKLKLGRDISLIPPRDFEGSVFTLKINFTNRAQLENRQSILDEVIQHPSFTKIIEGK